MVVSSGGGREVALSDLLDRLLQGAWSSRATSPSAAGIDLVQLDLRLLVAAIDTLAAS